MDVARRLLVVEIHGRQLASRMEHLLLPVDRAMAVAGLGVRVLICGAISQRMEQRLKGLGIKVIADVCGPAEDVLRAYLRGNLDDGDEAPRVLRLRAPRSSRLGGCAVSM